MSEVKSNIVRDIFYSIAEQVHIRAKQADTYVSKNDSSKINHELTRGDLKETAVLEAITKVLPSGYSTSTGFVADSTGNVSPQMDIIVFEQNEIPVAFIQKGNAVVPIETFKAAIEVKSTLKTDNFSQIKKQVKSLSQMQCFLHLPANESLRESKKLAYQNVIFNQYL